MKLGGFMMPLHPPGHNFTETIAADLEQIVEADRLGFSEYWIGEHFTAEWENIPAPDLLIAQALGRTKNIILGTGVTCLPNHHPFGLAHRIAQLDHMARGRFYWGVGSGGFPGDLEAFGFDLTSGENRKMTGQTIQAVLGYLEWPGARHLRVEVLEIHDPRARGLPLDFACICAHISSRTRPSASLACRNRQARCGWRVNAAGSQCPSTSFRR